jgi:glucose/arabinose dehydrogenase
MYTVYVSNRLHNIRGGRIKALAYFAALIAGAAGAEESVRFPEMLFTSEAARQIQRYDAAGKVVWTYPADTARDVWQLPNGNVLFPYSVSNGLGSAETGAMEVTPDKRIVWQFKTHGQVYSCQRMADGNTLVGATQQGKLLVVDPAGAVVKSFAVKNAAAGHGSMRNVRALPDGHFLVAEESARAAREYDAEGQLLREFKTPFPTYSAIRLPSGNTVTCGRTGILEFDAQGRPVWELKSEDVPELGMRWFAGLQVLPNGNLFICNAGGKVPFAEVSREKKVVWRCDPGQIRAGIGHGIQRLDVPGAPLK